VKRNRSRNSALTTAKRIGTTAGIVGAVLVALNLGVVAKSYGQY